MGLIKISRLSNQYLTTILAIVLFAVIKIFHFPKVKIERGRRSVSYFGPKLFDEFLGSLKMNLLWTDFKQELSFYSFTY